MEYQNIKIANHMQSFYLDVACNYLCTTISKSKADGFKI